MSERVRRAHDLTASRQIDVDRFVAALGPHDVLLVTGSLMEGLGNSRSDIDLYLIGPAHAAPIIDMEMHGATAVDVELLPLDEVRRMVDRVNGVDTGASPGLGDLDRYYRLLIAAPIHGAANFEMAALDLSHARACEVLRRIAQDEAELAAAAGTVHAFCGEDAIARAHLVTAVWWRMTALLTHRGEAYPSLKWTVEKALRSAGGREDTLLHEFLALLDHRGRQAAEFGATVRRWVHGDGSAASGADGRWRITRPVVAAADGSMMIVGPATLHAISGALAPLVRAMASDAGASLSDLAGELNRPDAQDPTAVAGALVRILEHHDLVAGSAR